MRGHDDVALFVIPTVTEVEIDWWRTALIENFFELRLIVLFKNFDRADVIAEDANVPFVAVEVSDRNAGVVLHDGRAMAENEIADAIESAFEHEIRRSFEKTRADAEVIAKFQETARTETAVGNVGREIVKGLLL